jgi:hypothetical protein
MAEAHREGSSTPWGMHGTGGTVHPRPWGSAKTPIANIPPPAGHALGSGGRGCPEGTTPNSAVGLRPLLSARSMRRAARRATKDKPETRKFYPRPVKRCGAERDGGCGRVRTAAGACRLPGRGGEGANTRAADPHLRVKLRKDPTRQAGPGCARQPGPEGSTPARGIGGHHRGRRRRHRGSHRRRNRGRQRRATARRGAAGRRPVTAGRTACRRRDRSQEEPDRQTSFEHGSILQRIGAAAGVTRRRQGKGPPAAARVRCSRRRSLRPSRSGTRSSHGWPSLLRGPRPEAVSLSPR